jgi:hypothetical protein
MISDMEQVRHAVERGAILQALKRDYNSKMSSVAGLSRALFMIGQSVTSEGMQFHLNLLADSGYIRIWRAEDLPTWRPDRESDIKPEQILFARLAPAGLGLIDGKIPADANVSF